MQTCPTLSYEDIHFRPHPLGYALALAGLMSIGAACIALATNHHPGWLMGLALAIILTIGLGARYTADGLIVRGYDLVLRVGTWTTHEVSQPIWEARPEIDQSFPGRLLGYGSVTLTIDGDPHAVNVAQIRPFLRLITAHRLQILGLVDRQALLQVALSPHMQARELEIQQG